MTTRAVFDDRCHHKGGIENEALGLFAKGSFKGLVRGSMSDSKKSAAQQ
jgi:hypothetical protein